MDKSSNPRPLGVCQRLMSFILAMMSRPGGSAEILIEDGMPRNGKSSANKFNKGRSSSDIDVEFRHAGSSVRAPKENGLNSTSGHSLRQTGIKQNNSSLTIQHKTGQDDRGNGIIKNVTVNSYDGGRAKKDGASHIPDESMKPRSQPQRRLEPSLSINKKSDIFIQQKKKDMRRSESFDPDKS